MNRNLKVKRLYSLGDFKNIEFTDEICDIPEKFLLNKEVMENLSYLQLIRIELDYAKYILLAKRLQKMNHEEMAIELENIRQETLKNLLDLTGD